MTTKFKIEQNPTFTMPVSIDRAGGDKIEVGFTFKYRTQSEVAELTDAWSARRKEVAEQHEGKEDSVPVLVEARIGLEVAELQDVVVGWEFDDEVSEASIRKLVESVITAKAAVLEAYFTGLNPARLGN